MSKVLDSGDNRYQLVKMIASGGFGEVWRAEDLREKRAVALKLFHLEKAGKGYLDLFKREFELLSELGHSHVARVYDFGFLPKQERYYFTSEFCEGKSLLEAIEGKPVAYFEECLVQILSALDYVHSQGIVHFDIKPENIIVEDKAGQPNVKLVD
ncbi:MAG: serine/threonine protein kinase, partial [Deltaproteobacteria bacterium]|nr:serine/threonine protein kinase [Deltaproteobacteria bacterium]